MVLERLDPSSPVGCKSLISIEHARREQWLEGLSAAKGRVSEKGCEVDDHRYELNSGFRR